ncbi:alpha-glucan family phosphorylase [Methylomonas sp. AM2-LC]|uniref:alpha-glucan family phosphorylase n=1 Tax=Methylomonas sp. AM2-LC TaxID=3153301 RepID=UPI003266D037
MLNQTRVSHPIYNLLPVEIEGFDCLAELALNMRWAWNHSTDGVWRQLDHELWEITHNPWVVLQTVSRDRIECLLADPVFRHKVDDLLKTRRLALAAPAWFQEQHADSTLGCIAYFSMEFMLSESLPIYSGGLGNVAGDQLKAASDLGVPIVGVGLLYQQGYFRQLIDKQGEQQALFPYNDPGQLPITPVRHANGEWLRLEISFHGYKVWLRTWQVEVGRVKLYLLDSNDAANFPEHRGITSELYGGDIELRLKQELLLGIGGWRLLAALGIKPDVCHLNEGHAAFAVLERAYCYMQQTGHAFAVALAATRAGNLFTTHTAVAAGFDRFEPALIAQYLAGYAEHKLGISLHQLLALGRQNPDDESEPFNMAYLAIRGSGAVNAVSQLHGKVSRHLFNNLFPHWPPEEVPVGYVTNGVHMPTWDSVAADELWTEACGKERWLGTTVNLEQDIRKLSDQRLWEFRIAASESFVSLVRKQLSRQRALAGTSVEVLVEAKHIFDPNVLTLGFARRFATYKRPNLLLQDPERLLRLLTNAQRPVQLILAGKAHPADKAGCALIKEWNQFIQRPEVSRHVVFLADYDMHLTSHLVQGVDVWLNTPLRPWEACGTSGMKVLVNGGLNLSELDGWWAEAYSPAVGWALGDRREHTGDTGLDAYEANCLYELLEREVIPEFYDRDENNIPNRWVNRMRESMAQLTPRFSASRAVCEYTTQHYLPAANAYHERCENNSVNALKMVDWQQSLTQNWQHLRFVDLTVTSDETQYEFSLQLFLGEIDPSAISVELFADGSDADTIERHTMQRVRADTFVNSSAFYKAVIARNRSLTDYTPRVIPCCAGVSIPLECQHILWKP